MDKFIKTGVAAEVWIVIFGDNATDGKADGRLQTPNVLFVWQ